MVHCRMRKIYIITFAMLVMTFSIAQADVMKIEYRVSVSTVMSVFEFNAMRASIARNRYLTLRNTTPLKN